MSFLVDKFFNFWVEIFLYLFDMWLVGILALVEEFFVHGDLGGEGVFDTITLLTELIKAVLEKGC